MEELFFLLEKEEKERQKLLLENYFLKAVVNFLIGYCHKNPSFWEGFAAAMEYAAQNLQKGGEENV